MARLSSKCSSAPPADHDGRKPLLIDLVFVGVVLEPAVPVPVAGGAAHGVLADEHLQHGPRMPARPRWRSRPPSLFRPGARRRHGNPAGPGSPRDTGGMPRMASDGARGRGLGSESRGSAAWRRVVPLSALTSRPSIVTSIVPFIASSRLERSGHARAPGHSACTGRPRRRRSARSERPEHFRKAPGPLVRGPAPARAPGRDSFQLLVAGPPEARPDVCRDKPGAAEHPVDGDRGLRPAATAPITVAPPETQSPPAKTPAIAVAPVRMSASHRRGRSSRLRHPAPPRKGPGPRRESPCHRRRGIRCPPQGRASFPFHRVSEPHAHELDPVGAAVGARHGRGATSSTSWTPSSRAASTSSRYAGISSRVRR